MEALTIRAKRNETGAKSHVGVNNIIRDIQMFYELKLYTSVTINIIEKKNVLAYKN